jgi:protein TonB
LICSLLFFIILLQFSKRLERTAKTHEKVSALFTVEEIPPATEQARVSVAPSRPTVPIASEDESLPDDATIDLTSLDLNAEPPPPPPPPSDDEDIFAFVPHDEPPKPVGGMAAVLRNIEYPEIARRAGVEGSVLLYVQVDEKGEIVNTRVMKLEGLDVFVTAAIKAVKSVKWKPAMQRDRPVKVWASVPIEFVLKTD